MMLDPAGRVAMVSGASRGIGRAVAERLLASGFRVAVGVRDPSAVAPREGLTAHRYEADDDGSSARAWVADAVASHGGRVDALVNAAGISRPTGLLDEDEAGLDEQWRVNAKGPARLTRAAWPHLVACGHGRVVNVASLSGKRVKNRHLGYAMSKFAVVALTHATRREGWESGIRATCVCPSFVDTDMTAYVQGFPRDKMTRPEDLAALVETALLLPDELVVAELLVNCRLEDAL